MPPRARNDNYMMNHINANKSVQFNPRVRVVEVMSVQDYNRNEVFDSWYQSTELQMMKQECKHAANLFASGKIKEQNNEHTMHCSRGLEARCEEAIRRKHESRRMSRAAVLIEQERQRRANKRSLDCIALKYGEHTKQCLVDAQMLANRDQKFVASELSAIRTRSASLNSLDSLSRKTSRSFVSNVRSVVGHIILPSNGRANATFY